MENSANCVPLDSELLSMLKSNYNNSFSMSTINPGNFVLSSYIWDVVLRTQFLSEDRSTPFEIRKIRDTFLEEMQPYLESKMEMTLFKQCALRLHHRGFQYCESDNYYEVPGILRTLAPTYETLVNGSDFYLQRCLQALPHSVIMKPFEYFKLYDIPKLRNTRIVSTISVQ